MSRIHSRFVVLGLCLTLLATAGCANRAPLVDPQSPAEPQHTRVSAEDEALLEDLSRRSFMYFWEQADANTGIVRDRSRTDGTPVDGNARDVGSIAAVGFGLAGLCIAAERGWVPRTAAIDRTRATLRFFANRIEQQRGWFFHFINIRTGAREWASELSSIDTALLLAGVLTVRQCFAGDTEIPPLADAIYRRVDFTWMLAGDPLLLAHGWKPESGFLKSRWDHYCELMILYLLAIGSPTHAIPADAWRAWRRPVVSFETYSYVGGPPPLFVHQYSHAWADFRGRREREPPHTDWWRNSIDATRAHKAFVLGLAQEFPGYSDTIWGITASDSRKGYVAWGGPPRSAGVDGTVVPSAVAGSLMLSPDITLPAVREMRRRFGDRIYGRYGFADAFHPTDGWVNPDVIGIDLGITLLSAENLRTGRVWTWFMRNREIPATMERVGLMPTRDVRPPSNREMDAFARDLRYAGRMLLREPGFTLLAILALALGIGATTAIFTVVDSVLLRPLPYNQSDRLVVTLHGPTASGPVSPADYLDYRRTAASFERLGAAQAWGATLGGGERTERVTGLQVSADLFDLLGVPPLAGRTFVQGDDEPGRERIVVLSHSLWQRRFGDDPSIVGRSIPLDGQPYVVVGVMPPGFRFAPFWQTRAEMWVPLSLATRRDDRSGRSLRLFGRLKDGVSLRQAQAEMTGLASQLARSHPTSNTGLGITVRPLLDKVVSGIRGTLVALLTMVTFVLLIACANVANTLLARASGRQREMAVRAALGAGRARVIRQLLTESVLLACSGAVVGLLFAVWGISWLLALLPPGSLPRQQEVSVDVRVFGVAALAALVSGLATGLVPAIQLARTTISSAFQDGAKGATEGPGRKRVRSLLVTGEVTLALVLVVGAGLMGRTMLKLSAVDPGFRPDHLAVASVSLAGTPHAAPAARAPMFLRIRDRLASLPGVTAVSAINHLPLAGDIWTLGYAIEGRPMPAAGERLSAAYRIVQPGYFDAMEMALSGRDFTSADGTSAPHVAIINQAMADRRWPGESPIGRRIRLPGVSEVQDPITIVGVAANARQSDWTGAPDDEVYLSFAQRAGEFGLSTLTFVLRTTVDPATVAAAIPREMAQLERSVPVTDAGTMSDVVANELWRERLTARLTGIFAVVALVLAAIGVYAVVAHAVARRTREFGVRVALGATRGHVVLLALGEALRPVMVGAVLGLVLALASSRFIQTFLFDVSAIDPLALAGAVAVLVLVAVCAAWLPARRASRQDPVSALRNE